MDVLTEFNLYEAIFWLVLGGGLWWARRHFVPPRLHTWATFTALNLVLFGTTDLVELYTGGFLHTAPWLLWWKAAHVVGLVISAGWYVRLRW